MEKEIVDKISEDDKRNREKRFEAKETSVHKLYLKAREKLISVNF